MDWSHCFNFLRTFKIVLKLSSGKNHLKIHSYKLWLRVISYCLDWNSLVRRKNRVERMHVGAVDNISSVREDILFHLINYWKEKFTLYDNTSHDNGEGRPRLPYSSITITCRTQTIKDQDQGANCSGRELKRISSAKFLPTTHQGRAHVHRRSETKKNPMHHCIHPPRAPAY